MASSGKAKGKEKDKAQQQVQPQVPTSVEPAEREVVLGRLKESEWHQLIGREQASEVASGLVAEVLDVAIAILFQRYLDREVIPHSVGEAKKTLLQMVEWYFLSRDEGVSNITGTTWTEDEEPAPATIDSWARGIVFQTPLELLETPIEVVKPEVVLSPPDNDHTPPSSCPEDGRGSHRDMATPPTSTLVNRHSISTPLSQVKTPSNSGIKATHRPRPQAHKPKPATLQPPPPDSANQSSAAVMVIPDVELITHSLTPTTSTAMCLPRPQGGVRMTQYGGVKEVSYDDEGNIVSMIKLDTSKFPSHSIRPKVSFLPPSADEPGDEVKGHRFSRVPKNSRRSHGKRGVVFSSGDRARDSVSPRRFPEVPSLPPLVDTINPAPGVIIREAGRTVHGTRVNTPSTLVLTSLSKLRPVLPASVEMSVGGNSPLRQTEAVP